MKPVSTQKGAIRVSVSLLSLLLAMQAGCSLAESSRSPIPTATLPPTSTATVTGTPSPSATPEADTPTTEIKPPLPPVSAEFDPHLLGMVLRNQVYCTMEGVDLEMDLYFPAEATSGWPAVMYIHGGGWTSGDKNHGAGIEELPALTEAGFLAVAINYRLAPDHPFPAMIEDARCAVRYLRAHAGAYNLDPSRVGVYGGSAGGHLAALMGTSGLEAGWEVGDYLWESSRVQAVVDFFGPSWLTEPEFLAGMDVHRLEVFGAVDRSDIRLILASPVSYITADDPPFLILHGDHDTAVPLSQSVALYQLLLEAGVSAQLVVVQNGGHGFGPSGGGEMSPSREEITRMTVDFFRQQLMP